MPIQIHNKKYLKKQIVVLISMSLNKKTSAKKIVRTFMNQDEKDCILRIIAETYIQEGEGYDLAKPKLQRKLGKAITSFSYSNFMTTIMRSSFRYLQDFITKSSKKIIRPITFEQERIIRTPMINCRKWMEEKQLETLFAIIKGVVLQIKEEITFQRALGLYRSLKYLISHEETKSKFLKTKKKGREGEEAYEKLGLTMPSKKKKEVRDEDEEECQSELKVKVKVPSQQSQDQLHEAETQ